MSEQLLFVYGSLRRGLANAWAARLAREARWLGHASVQGAVYDLGGYPGLMPARGQRCPVQGDLYRLPNPARTFSWLDRYEGCSRADPAPHEYRRVRLPVRDARERPRLAWVYILNRPAWRARPLRPAGCAGRVTAPREAARGACARTLRIVQLTDLHLFEHDQGWLDWHHDCRHVNTHATLNAVLAEMNRQERHVDAVVVTGDIAQSPTELTYQRVRAWLGELRAPVYCLPGNHDDAALMRQVLAGQGVTAPDHVVLGRWLLVLLDSTVAGQSAGTLGQGRLDALETLLTGHADRNAVVFIHHPPVAVGSAWLDRIGLRDGSALLTRLKRHRHVKAVVFGHIHQGFDAQWQHLRLLGTPSTCVQFLPRRAAHFYDRLPPAYRWIDLHPDGHLTTGVHYVHGDPRGPAPGVAKLSLR